MKRLLMAALLIATFAASAFASETSVNRLVLNQFKADFKNASNVSWKTAGEFAKVSFTQNGEQTEVFYSSDGEVVAIAKNISIEALPTEAKRKFAQKYDGYTVKEAIKLSSEEDAYFDSAENDKESVIIKVSVWGTLSVFQKTKK